MTNAPFVLQSTALMAHRDGESPARVLDGGRVEEFEIFQVSMQMYTEGLNIIPTPNRGKNK